MRFLALVICVPAILAGQDAREIVRRSIEAESAGVEVARNYTYLEREETRELDGSGKLKNREVHTYDVTLLEGSPYRRLVGQNDQPLTAKEQKKEEEKLRQSNQARSQETEAQKRQRIEDWRRKQEKQREPMREIPDAFDLRLLPDETLNGRAMWVIDATPKAGYKPKVKSAFFFPKVKMRFWIDRQDYHAIKAEIETLDTISWGGILARLAKGDRLTLEETRVNDEVWLPKGIRITGSARVLLVKGFRGEIEISYSNYKRFSTESRVVSVGQ
ncbi:MAG: hypothetical protein ABSF62_03760 [Bryobacteraceae bacterium]